PRDDPRAAGRARRGDQRRGSAPSSRGSGSRDARRRHARSVRAAPAVRSPAPNGGRGRARPDVRTASVDAGSIRTGMHRAHLLIALVAAAFAVAPMPARAQSGAIEAPVVFTPKPGTTLAVEGNGPFHGAIEVRRSP